MSACNEHVLICSHVAKGILWLMVPFSLWLGGCYLVGGNDTSPNRHPGYGFFWWFVAIVITFSLLNA